MKLSGVYTVCLTVFHYYGKLKYVILNLGKNIKKLYFILTISSMDQVDMCTKYEY